MKTVLQRVTRASVRVDDNVVGQIGHGILALVGVERGDTEADAIVTARKIATLRMFPGKTPFDQNITEVGGACLVVSQFTLAGSVVKGRRPSFDRAQPPQSAEPLYERVIYELRARDLTVETGRFGASMMVDICNDGPVTLLIFTHQGVLI